MVRIIDIGGGHNPRKEADIVTDLYLDGDTTSRGNPQLKLYPHQKFVQCDIHEMPFKDKEFDYSYCSHVLEHVKDPIKACSEIMRISKAGYIETPKYIWEVLFGRRYHLWTIHNKENCLVFKPKKSEIFNNNFQGDKLFSKVELFRESFKKNIDIFYMKFEWKNSFEVMVADGKVD